MTEMAAGDTAWVNVPATLPHAFNGFVAAWKEFVRAADGHKVTLICDQTYITGWPGWEIVSAEADKYRALAHIWIPTAWLTFCPRQGYLFL